MRLAHNLIVPCNCQSSAIILVQVIQAPSENKSLVMSHSLSWEMSLNSQKSYQFFPFFMPTIGFNKVRWISDMVNVYLTLYGATTHWAHPLQGQALGSVLLYCITFTWFWNQTPVEGLNSLLFQSCSEWEAPGVGLLTSPPAFEAASCWEDGSGWYVCICTWQQLRLPSLLTTWCSV